jgi:hypothetical protein
MVLGIVSILLRNQTDYGKSKNEGFLEIKKWFLSQDKNFNQILEELCQKAQ